MPGRPNGKVSQVYAYNLVDRITQHFDYLVDLHTASDGRVNSLYVRADLKQEMTAQMAYLLRPQIVVHNPPSDYTLRGTAAEAGKPAITVEICDPQKFQSDPITRTVKGIRHILNHIGMIPSRRPTQAVTTKPPTLCRKSYWILAERGGMVRCFPRIAERVSQGQLIASQVNIFDDTIRHYRAPEDGIVIGHCVNPIGQTGARILHLGVPMDDEERQKFERISGCSLDGSFCRIPTQNRKF
jgi:predicted deacylase